MPVPIDRWDNLFGQLESREQLSIPDIYGVVHLESGPIAFTAHHVPDYLQND